MFAAKIQSALTGSQTSWQLIRRLLTEQAMVHWKRYVLAFALMGLAAGATALIAYVMISQISSASPVSRNAPRIGPTSVPMPPMIGARINSIEREI